MCGFDEVNLSIMAHSVLYSSIMVPWPLHLCISCICTLHDESSHPKEVYWIAAVDPVVYIERFPPSASNSKSSCTAYFMLLSEGTDHVLWRCSNTS